jgi:hypothetical protein
MKKPPQKLDGAKVLIWAWSGDLPFGRLGSDIEIFGLAICTYDEKGIYRFSCDQNWDVQQDGLYNSIEEAINQLPEQYKEVSAKWNKE